MKILITGICGYVGSHIAIRIKNSLINTTIYGIDNLSRRGSESNIHALNTIGVKFFHGDIRCKADIDNIPKVDWVIDCAANPSVLAGIKSINGSNSKQLVENNLSATLNILEYCKKHESGLILLSTSRVYSAEKLTSIKLKETKNRFTPSSPFRIEGFSKHGVSEMFSTTPPLSLYGATKLSSEIMALEYANAFNFPLWINRSGVTGGPGQFGKPDQGIFAFWVYSYALNKPLKYIGFGGKGKQVRDLIKAEDVADLLIKQIKNPNKKAPKIINLGGGPKSALSLKELNIFCQDFFNKKIKIKGIQKNRPYDVPYYVTDTRLAQKTWNWQPSQTSETTINEICHWAKKNTSLIKKWWQT